MSTTAVSKVVSAITDFGFDLFAELTKQNGDKNLFVSPASIAFALAMTYNGARDETARAMAQTLRVQDLDLTELNQSFAALMSALDNIDPKIKLAIANSLWLREESTCNDDFMQIVRQFYKAQVTTLDFGAPDAADTINNWVSKQTSNKIKQIVTPPEIYIAELALINALYFKANWAKQFDKADTKDSPFTLLNGSQKQVPMMSQHGRFMYYQGQGFQAVSLPYVGHRLSMYIFLPDKNSSLDEFQKQLNTENWNAWMSHFHEMKGYIALPRFTVAYEVELNRALTALGMGIAFGPGANFDGISPGLYISKVKHKTFAEVNEEGTEAAAATVVLMTRMSIPFSFVVDRPFFCAIRDNETGMLLFMGFIVDPE